MKVSVARRSLALVILNIVAILVLAGFGPPKLVDREFAPAIRLTPTDLRQWHDAAQPPVISSHALLVYDVDAQRTLYSRNADVAMPPASLTKLMTALLVLENGNLDDTVEVMAEDLVGGATMGLNDGETLTVHDLLYGMLIASGNDAAMALARHVSGDANTFVDSMNERAQEIGLTETYFVNPNGFDAEGHVGSASDILALVLRLLDFPLFNEIVAISEADVGGHVLHNTNELLDVYPGVDGIKTGTTTMAGQCLVASINPDGRRLLVVVMGSDDRYTDATNLYELYQVNYKWEDGDSSELSVLNRLYDDIGKVHALSASGEPPSTLRHRWGDPELVSFRDITVTKDVSLTAPVKVGAIEWSMGDELLDDFELTVR